MLGKLSPKRLFGSSKKRHVSRSDSSASSSDETSVKTPTSILPSAVSVRELEELLVRLGSSRSEVAELVGELGADEDGLVSLEALMGRAGPVNGPELRGTFDFFDADGDGKITAGELQGALRALGDMRCTLEDCRRMIAVVDGNGDGFVCFDDFTRMMMSSSV